jgi:uncharacterized membrane protein YhaH (DUF805 family)
MKWYLLVLSKYAQFSGRARRSEYWYFVLFHIIILLSLKFFGIFIRFPFLNLIYALAVLLPAIAVKVRRMHDVGKSGWFIFIPIYSLILECTEGQSGENEYGEDPKQPTGFDEINQIGSNLE